MDTLELLVGDLQKVETQSLYFDKVSKIRQGNNFTIPNNFDAIRNFQSHIDNLTSGDAGDHTFDSHDDWNKK